MAQGSAPLRCSHKCTKRKKQIKGLKLKGKEKNKMGFKGGEYLHRRNKFAKRKKPVKWWSERSPYFPFHMEYVLKSTNSTPMMSWSNNFKLSTQTNPQKVASYAYPSITRVIFYGFRWDEPEHIQL